MVRSLSFVLVLALLATACAGHPVAGPPTLAPGTVIAVRVTPLPLGSPGSHLIKDPTTVLAIALSYAMNSRGWEEPGGRELVPKHRIDLLDAKGTRGAYWIGETASTFPCYSLCKGGWIAPSDDHGDIDTSTYKDLSEAAYSSLRQDLGITQ